MPTITEISTEQLAEYAGKVRFIVLATVDENNAPALRSLGSWALDGTTLYFSTSNKTDKAKQIAANPKISVQLQQEGQELASYVNYTFRGKAKLLESAEDRAPGIVAISLRSPRFKERAEKNELGETAIFALPACQIKLLDFSKGLGPASLTVYSSSCKKG